MWEFLYEIFNVIGITIMVCGVNFAFHCYFNEPKELN